jgi:aryl-alcohol dehydrogenase-like predicted oxidoreductase
VATPEATEGFDDDAYNGFCDLRISSVGVGTYLGDPDDTTDTAYVNALSAAFENGCNVVDTSINYRHQRSERSVGDALKRADVARDEVFVATKGGYIPFDGGVPEDPSGYIRENYVETGLVPPDETVRANCLAPDFLRNQVSKSLENLGIDTVDLYYVHNPETHLREASQEEFDRRLRRAFEALEDEVEAGRVDAYGVATWNGFRVPETRDEHLSMERVAEIARHAANGESALEAVQLPYNASMRDAATDETQTVYGGRATPLEAADELDLYVFTSASLMQGELVDERVEDVPRKGTPAQDALEYARSTDGVGTALVGCSSREHVEENLAVLRR